MMKERVNSRQELMKSSWKAAFPAEESWFHKHPLQFSTVLMEIKP